jgi:hypothetical protein
MPIGRANGLITAQDINLEAGLAYNANMPFSTRASEYVNSGASPLPNQAPNFIKMSGYGESSGFWGATRASGHISNSFMFSNGSLPTELRLNYNTAFSVAFFVRMNATSTPIPNGYQPRMWYSGGNTFGQNTIELFYEGKLSNGTYSNKMIARMTRAGYPSGRRDYRWDMGTNGIFTNGAGWNSVNYPRFYHMVFTYNGGGPASGAFQLYINGNLMTVNQTNNVTDATSTWTYTGAERLTVGAPYYNTTPGLLTNWYYSGIMWFDRVISAAEVTTLYNGGAGVGLNAVDTDGHWWGLSANTNDRIASYSQATAYANYNFIYESGSMYFNQDVRPSY